MKEAAKNQTPKGEIGGQTPKQAESTELNPATIENDLFNKHYNKELRVSKDEIPIVLAELNESAIAFIKKDQFEKALNLL